MTWQSSFRVIIRVIFIFAYIAFLAASIRHIATFFHNFEEDQTDWVNPYTLAVSIDLTSLVLTVGVMFFRKNMPWYAQLFTWIFIIALTGFSWFVNWEYAMTYQGNDLQANDTLRMINPILASSFAFLNLAYSVVAEFFSSKTETASELAAKVDELEQLEEHQKRLAAYNERTKKPGMIERAKNTALEARAAVNEVLDTKKDEIVVPEVQVISSRNAPQVSTTENIVSEDFSSVISQQPVNFFDDEEQTFYSMLSEETSEVDSEELVNVRGEELVKMVVNVQREEKSLQTPLPEASQNLYPKPRITTDLSKVRSEGKRNTDDLEVVKKNLNTSKQKTSTASGDAAKRVERILRRNPGMKGSEVASRANVSESYVSQIRSKLQQKVSA